MGWAIELGGLTKSFGSTKAVDNLSLNVEEGSIFGFLGPNGAGKTTTIKTLVGLLSPDKGGGRILGLDIIKDAVEIRKRVGYVPERPQFYGYMTVEEILAFNASLFPRWNQALVEKYLSFFGLPAGARIKGLSSGMKTQLALVLALGTEPEVLILDEPTSGLDPINRQELLRIILEEISVQGRTVFFSSHILHDVERVADKVAIITNGKLLDVREMDELKTSVKKIRVVFQGEPGPEVFSQPGIESYTRDGKAYVISVVDNFPEVLQGLQREPHYTLEIIDRNLEEIFIERVRGDHNEQGPSS